MTNRIMEVRIRVINYEFGHTLCVVKRRFANKQAYRNEVSLQFKVWFDAFYTKFLVYDYSTI